MNDEIIVVKYGSSSVSGNSGIDRAKISKYARKIKDLSSDYKIAIVSSGAVVAGRAILGADNSADSTTHAMVGSATLVVAWQKAFAKHNINVGQILVTHNDIADKIEGNRLRTVIHDVLNEGIIPVINENDVLSDVELAKLLYGGDNDGLASKIAITIGAAELLLLTNVDGLLDSDGLVVKSIDSTSHETALLLTNGKSDSGRGGMSSKIEAAVAATKSGVRSHIGNASSDYKQLIAGKIGTIVK